MKLIDRATVQRILDAADIVEVVSDFVNLKKRGANYIGLCPFHNERTPSFSVSRAKGICKCFSCGKGGSPVNFIMEHEQLSYNDALRYLAKKYHIEIKERELTDDERRQASERESLLAVNDFALDHFSHNLSDTADGRDIGYAYFRERGINDAMIARFKLGYALDKPDVLYKAAVAKGFDEKYLFEAGLCSKSERGQVYDRFRGRVIYPVFSVSGRVVAFGGRTLRKDKNVAKYVNSPESPIYHKSRELYGLYQAKQAIVKRDKCILVEGYMDVISMHQVGVDNVVASSGTSLTEGQIRLIHRFTENVTVIYDADAAGIKASLRGIDMLLAEGMNVKVLLLPQGEDPDSFAQSHSATEVEEYIAQNETDFIRFKTKILLADVHDDPMGRARVINDIIRSIAVIPDMVVRAEYVKLCSRMLEIEERTLMLQLQKLMADNGGKRNYPKPDAPETAADVPADTPPVEPPADPHDDSPSVQKPAPKPVHPATNLAQYEKELLKYVVKYGMASLPVAEGEQPLTVLEYVWGELYNDGIDFTFPIYNKVYNMALDILHAQWAADLQAYRGVIEGEYDAAMRKGEENIRVNAVDLADIQAREQRLKEVCDAAYFDKLDTYSASYLEGIFLSHPDDDVRTLATDLVAERYTLSKVHTHYAHVPTEREKLIDLVPRAVAELKLAIINEKIAQNYEQIKSHGSDETVVSLLMEQKKLFAYRAALAKFLGDRIVTPKRK